MNGDYTQLLKSHQQEKKENPYYKEVSYQLGLYTQKNIKNEGYEDIIIKEKKE